MSNPSLHLRKWSEVCESGEKNKGKFHMPSPFFSFGDISMVRVLLLILQIMGRDYFIISKARSIPLLPACC